MKLINKLVPTLSIVGATAGIVVPLTTSCSAGKTYNYHITSADIGVKAIPVKATTATIYNATSIYLEEVSKNYEILANDIILDVAYWSAFHIFDGNLDNLKDLNIDIKIKIDKVDVEYGRLSFSMDETFSYKIHSDVDPSGEDIAISGHYNSYVKNMEYLVFHEGKSEETGDDIWNLRPKFAVIARFIQEWIPEEHDDTRHKIVTAFLQGQPDWECGISEFIRLDNLKYNVLDETFKFTRNVFDAELLAGMCDGTPDLLSVGHSDGLASMRSVAQPY